MDGRESVSGQVAIRDPIGLHARPAVKLTRLAKSFEADVRLRVGEQDDWINAKSPNRVMKLKARHGDLLRIQAEGPDAKAALAALLDLVERNFDG